MLPPPPARPIRSTMENPKVPQRQRGRVPAPNDTVVVRMLFGIFMTVLGRRHFFKRRSDCCTANLNLFGAETLCYSSMIRYDKKLLWRYLGAYPIVPQSARNRQYTNTVYISVLLLLNKTHHATYHIISYTSEKKVLLCFTHVQCRYDGRSDKRSSCITRLTHCYILGNTEGGIND